jgi:hypothetical protein
VTLARLMEADIKPLKVDSLDEIARLMEDVRRRLALARAGKAVRDEEDQIVAKLEKMIEELEKQRQEQQRQKQQRAANPRGKRPNNPLDDSRAAELKAWRGRSGPRKDGWKSAARTASPAADRP